MVIIFKDDPPPEPHDTCVVHKYKVSGRNEDSEKYEYNP